MISFLTFDVGSYHDLITRYEPYSAHYRMAEGPSDKSEKTTCPEHQGRIDNVLCLQGGCSALWGERVHVSPVYVSGRDLWTKLLT